MLFVLVGAVVGVLVGLGKVPAADEIATALAESSTGLGSEGFSLLLDRFNVDPTNEVRVVVETLVIALMPGLIAALLMAAARSGSFLRRIGALFSAVAGIWTILTYDSAGGLVAGGILIVVGAAFAFIVGSTLSLVGSALSATIAVSQIRLFLDGDTERFQGASQALRDVAGAGDVRLWTLLLAAASVIIPITVLYSAISD